MPLVKPVFCKDHELRAGNGSEGQEDQVGAPSRRLGTGPGGRGWRRGWGDRGGELVRHSGGKTNRTWREVDGGACGKEGGRCQQVASLSTG